MSGPSSPTPNDPIVGCDVVDIDRMRRLIVERPGSRERLFGPDELQDAERGGVDPDGDVAVARLAGRFAVKEAVRKALRGRGPTLTSIEVRTDQDGAPTVWISGRPTRFACSISHDAGVAMAVVVGDLSMLDDVDD